MGPLAGGPLRGSREALNVGAHSYLYPITEANFVFILLTAVNILRLSYMVCNHCDIQQGSPCLYDSVTFFIMTVIYLFSIESKCCDSLP